MNKKILIITTIILLIDQISKFVISSFINLNESVKVIKNFFYLTYANNTGGAWSILSNQTLLLVVIGLFAILIIVKYMNSFTKNTRNNIAFGLLLGGISGNLLDRIFYGYVRDFFHFHIINYDFPIFNISDMAIFFGVILLIIAIIKGEDNDHSSKRKSQ